MSSRVGQVAELIGHMCGRRGGISIARHGIGAGAGLGTLAPWPRSVVGLRYKSPVHTSTVWEPVLHAFRV